MKSLRLPKILPIAFLNSATFSASDKLCLDACCKITSANCEDSAIESTSLITAFLTYDDKTK
jgi:hypothetical protein